MSRALAALLLALVAACGVKGPPRPPVTPNEAAAPATGSAR